jgi:hypothetical protein
MSINQPTTCDPEQTDHLSDFEIDHRKESIIHQPTCERAPSSETDY